VFTRSRNNFFWISRIAVVCADFRGHPKLRTKKLAFASAGNTYFMKHVMRGMGKHARQWSRQRRACTRTEVSEFEDSFGAILEN
jgi:hypothetical protein